MARTFIPHLFVLCGIGLSTAGRGQAPPTHCALSQELGPVEPEPFCQQSGLSVLNDWRQVINHTPGSSPFRPSGAIRTVNVVINVWGNGTPTGNYQNDPVNTAGFEKIIHDLDSAYWTYPELPSDPTYHYAALDTVCTEPSMNWYTCHRDTYMRLNLVGVFYHNDPAMFASNCEDEVRRDTLTVRAIEANPICRKAINIHLVQGLCCSGAGAADLPDITFDFSRWTPLVGVTTCQQSSTGFLDADQIDFLTSHWAHEIGHVLGLRHLYPSLGAYENVTYQSFDFLYDVFGMTPEDTVPQAWCTAAPNTFCYFDPNDGDPFADPNDPFINTLMADNAVSDRHISPMQMGRMNRALMLTRAGCSAWGYDPVPYHQPAWPSLNPFPRNIDFRVKMFQDLVVDSGAVLVVSCTLEFVPQARLVVERGGKLIIDGGLIRAAQFADSVWQGIEVRGDEMADRSIRNGTGPGTSWPAMYNHQGSIEFKNGGRIENAKTGILFGSRDEAGKGGGVLITDLNYPAIMRNCATGIEYHPYTAAAGDALSAARHIRFERDSTALPGPSGPYLLRHIKTTDMHPLLVENCWFTNQQPGIIGSLDLGQGITSINTGLTVRPACVVGPWPCAAALQRPNIFTGMDHGVELFTTTGSAYTTITNNTFTNNIAGVYANGMAGLSITNNQFTLGNNPAALVGSVDEQFANYHRGLYTYNSWGLRIRDNTLAGDPTGPGGNTEGIVIGYNRDHNDVVYQNEIANIAKAFVGEGICAESFNGGQAMIGLQFRCNVNDTNDLNISSRKVLSDEDDIEPYHTIRTNQGYRVAADNLFDNWPQSDPDRWDYYIDTDWPIRYRYRTTDPVQLEYQPTSYDTDLLTLQGIYRPNQANPFCLWYFEQPNVPRTPQVLGALITEEKLAYGNTRYLYDELLDGGSTDEVVLEISSAWPNEAWELRDYLLGLSPFLSVEALKEAVNKTYFPMAMKAEVCIANPDATKSLGFITWLEEEADEPMPAYLIELIKASWETNTYRTELEMELADHHTELTQTAHELLDLYHEPGSTATLDEMRWVWQQIRTTAARYAEAAIAMGVQDYPKAAQVVESIPTDHELKDEQWEEQQRMLDYIELLKNALGAGRMLSNLDSAEVDALRNLRNDGHDRASNWINNLLCQYYQDCTPPCTGGGPIQPKSLRSASASVEEEMKNSFVTAPNPAEAWVSFTYAFRTPRDGASIHVQDAVGREVAVLAMPNAEGQLVLDTRQWGTGLYAVSYINAGAVEQLDKLIVR